MSKETQPGTAASTQQWVFYNPQTATYDTPDGTSVAAELVDGVQCLADVLHIASIRAKQRAAKQPTPRQMAHE